MLNFGTTMISAIQESFQIFGLTIHWYGVILTSAMVIALVLFTFLAKREKVESDFCLTMFLFAIIFAIVGARLFYVLPRFETYFTSWEGFKRAFMISEGGLTIIGGIPMGALGILICCKIYKKSPFRIFDLVVPALLLGQVLGRWGNFINGELYGFEITNPAFQKFPIAVFVWHEGAYEWHAANFFYEMMLNLVGLIIVLALTFTIKKKLKVGFLSFFYLIWYGLVRGCLEFVKIDQLMWGNVRAIQLICFICVGIGIILLVLLQKGIIKLETQKMYEKHFQIVYEPPEYIESVVNDIVVNANDIIVDYEKKDDIDTSLGEK